VSKRSQHRRVRSSKNNRALQYMMAYPEDRTLHEGSISSESESDTPATTEHTGGHQFPNMTQSQVGHYENAIEHARTQSDFDKLEKMIQRGQRIEVQTESETATLRNEEMGDGHALDDDEDEELAPPDPSRVDPAFYSSPYQMRQGSDQSGQSGYANLPNMESKNVGKRKLMVLDEEELERKLHRVANQQNPGGHKRVLSIGSPIVKTVSISPINRTYISDMENLTSQEVTENEM